MYPVQSVFRGLMPPSGARPQPTAAFFSTDVRRHNIALSRALRRARKHTDGAVLSALGLAVAGTVVLAHEAGRRVAGGAQEAAQRAAASLAPLLANDALVSSASGGVACAAMDSLYFIDTMKVRLQTGTPLLHGGLAGLYNGVGPSCAFRFVHGALYMPLYEATKHAFADARAPLVAAVTAAAATATVLTSLIEVPVEALLLRVKSGRAGADFLSAARHAIASPGGVAALYAGAGAYVARHVLYESLEFVVYEQLRARTLAQRRLAPGGEAAAASDSAHSGGHGAGLAVHEAAMAAFAASVVAAVASQPLDCIRVAVSLSASGQGAAPGAAAAASMSARAAAAKIIREKGVAGLFTGLLPRVATLAPGACIFFTVFEATRTAAEKLRAQQERERAAAAAAKLQLADCGCSSEQTAALTLAAA